jgi:hypothetical protein
VRSAPLALKMMHASLAGDAEIVRAAADAAGGVTKLWFLDMHAQRFTLQRPPTKWLPSAAADDGG